MKIRYKTKQLCMACYATTCITDQTMTSAVSVMAPETIL